MALDTATLKASFEAIKPVAGQVVDYFYDVLFQSHPEAKTLFKAERMDQQKTALIQSLVTIFDRLEEPEKLKSYLTHLGSRHIKYGVKPEHYDWVAESLLETLKYFFDKSWTAELEDAWMVALGLIAEVMRSAQSQPQLNVVKEVESQLLKGMKEEIEKVLRELMSQSVKSIAQSREIQDLAIAEARSLIRETLTTQLAELRERFKDKKAA